MEFFVPDDIDLESLVKEVKRPDVKRNLIYGCAYILNHFYLYPKTLKGKAIFEKTGGGVPLNVKTLRSEIGARTADRSMKFLSEKNVIQTTGKYVPVFNISRVYTLCSPPETWVSLEFACDSKNQEALGKAEDSELDINPKQIDFLTRWLGSEEFLLEYRSVDFFIQYFYNRLYFEIVQISISYQGAKRRAYISKLKGLLNQRFHEIIQAVKGFENSKSSFSRSKTNHRLNTAVTQMIKPVRNFLTFGDETLVEIDLAASQPFFLYVLLRRLKNFKNEENSTNLSEHQSISHYHIPLSLNIHHMVCTFSTSDFVELSLEIDRFGELFQNASGDFYQNLAETLNSVSDPVLAEFSSRERTKKAFMHLLFERFEGNKKSIPTYQVFRKSFPRILLMMDGMKSQEKNRLAIALQRMESEVILDCIARKFADNNPNVPLFTIHDALLTTEPFVNTLELMIKAELAAEVDFSPAVKMKRLEPESLLNDLDESIGFELNLLRRKARSKKGLTDSKYLFPVLFGEEIPVWKGEEVKTISVWAQVRSNPKYQPIKFPKNSISNLGDNVVEVFVRPIFSGDINGNRLSEIKLKKGYVVTPLFDFED